LRHANEPSRNREMIPFFGVFKAVISHEFYPNNYTMKSMLADCEPQKRNRPVGIFPAPFQCSLNPFPTKYVFEETPSAKRYLIIERT
jgi:hypothetical protein